MIVNRHDAQYHALLHHVLDNGILKDDRTGTGTISVFGTELRFDVSDGSIPLLTTKKMHIPSIIHEMVWYFSGSTNIQYLLDNKVRIWNEWANDEGELGPLYGKMMRDWDGVDQLAFILNELRTNPDSRRMVVSYWDPRVLPNSDMSPEDNATAGKQALAPCHYTWQVYTTETENGRRQLSLKMTQRSMDVFLGCPFNIAQYSIILHLLCHMTDMDPGEFILSAGDTHIYNNHIDQVTTQIANYPLSQLPPKLQINGELNSFDDFTYDSVSIVGYQSCGPIAAKVAK